MAILSFSGNLVGAVGSFNDDGDGGTDIELNQSVDLDGNGNPWYSATDTILIEIDDADIGPDRELLEGGADDKVTVLSVKINGVEQLVGPDTIKFDSGGGATEMGDGYFFIEGLELAVLSPATGVTFEDSEEDNGKLILNVEDRVDDFDLNNNDNIDAGTAEIGDGVFNVNNSNIVCFTRGTLVSTKEGDVPIETLSVGDLIATLDHGFRPVRLIVHRKLNFPQDESKHKPIEFKPGSLGPGLPRRTLCVSPQHRIFVSSQDGEATGHACGMLVAAKGLTHHRGVRQKLGCKDVEYYHLIFDCHEVIFSEGVATESFYPGHVALGTLDDETRKECLAIFPQLKLGENAPIRHARPFIRAGKARQAYPRSRQIRSPLVAR